MADIDRVSSNKELKTIWDYVDALIVVTENLCKNLKIWYTYPDTPKIRRKCRQQGTAYTPQEHSFVVQLLVVARTPAAKWFLDPDEEPFMEDLKYMMMMIHP